ncbi:MAG: hypothetical protein V3T83_03295, partial [Acidobacteriota bacterium]
MTRSRKDAKSSQSAENKLFILSDFAPWREVCSGRLATGEAREKDTKAFAKFARLNFDCQDYDEMDYWM